MLRPQSAIMASLSHAYNPEQKINRVETFRKIPKPKNFLDKESMNAQGSLSGSLGFPLNEGGLLGARQHLRCMLAIVSHVRSLV